MIKGSVPNSKLNTRLGSLAEESARTNDVRNVHR